MPAKHQLLELGRVKIPQFVRDEVAFLKVPEKTKLVAYMIGEAPTRKSYGQILSSRLQNWVGHVAKNLGAKAIWSPAEAMIFGNVHVHNDGPVWVRDGQRFMFLHIDVMGVGDLIFPTVKEAAKNKVRFGTCGAVFAFDPRVNHAVINAERFGIRSLGLVVAF